MTSIVGILAQDFEALQRLTDLGPFDVRGFDPSAARSGSHPGNNGGHSVASTLQQRFDRAVSPVAYPADDTVRVGLLLQGAAKVDALYPPADDNVSLCAFSIRRHANLASGDAHELDGDGTHQLHRVGLHVGRDIQGGVVVGIVHPVEHDRRDAGVEERSVVAHAPQVG